MPVNWEGVFPAATTQFHSDFSLDIDATLTHLNAMLDAGIHGLIMLGTVGENCTLERAEKLEVLKATVDAVAGRVPVLTGVAEYTTAQACRFAAEAQSIGVDGLMVLPAMVYNSDARETMTHFRGVATVVAKLFNMVRPQVAVFGLKDYQQYLIVRRLVEDLNFEIEIVGCPIVREADGLAMSSRNRYLNREEKKAALCLSRALRKAQDLVRQGTRDGEGILQEVRAEITREPLVHLEYLRLCDPKSLEDVETIEGEALLALAVQIGRARLIDNSLLGE